jgi:hypothetical protein
VDGVLIGFNDGDGIIARSGRVCPACMPIMIIDGVLYFWVCLFDNTFFSFDPTRCLCDAACKLHWPYIHEATEASARVVVGLKCFGRHKKSWRRSGFCSCCGALRWYLHVSSPLYNTASKNNGVG